MPRPRLDSPHAGLALALGLSFALQAPAFFAPHRELDERIFLSLAENLRTGGHYSLQGLPLLEQLSPGIYDRPLFHHPPLFPALLVPFAGTSLAALAPLVPWLGAVSMLVAAWLVLRRFGPTHGFWSHVFPLCALAIDPLLSFTSAHLWIDALLGGLCALSVSLFVLGLGHTRRAQHWTWAGIFWGLALLTKAPALACGLLFVPLVFREARRDGSLRALREFGLCVALPAACLFGPWLALFHAEYGMWLPNWTRPDAWMVEHSAFVAAAVGRPPHYYVGKWLLVNPLLLVIAATAVLGWRSTRAPEGLLWAWFTGALALLSALGLWGQGYQMRFVTLAIAPLYLVLGAQHARAVPRASVVLALWLAFACNLVTDVRLALHPDLAEVVGLVQLAARAVVR